MGEKSLECPVCLQTCIHPVMLPCKHIFCYLCIKGVANQSKRCALCRREIPLDFLSNPLLIKKEDLLQTCSLEDGKQWYYEGRHGWWQYDERTTSEMEERYKAGDKHCEILIAGFLYVIDFEQMLQYRRNDHTRRRRIKRDAATAPKKGVAGLKIAGETSDTPLPPQDDGQGIAQNSPPQSPQSPEDPVSPNPEDLSSTMASLSLDEARRLEHRHYLDSVMVEDSPQRSSFTRSSRLVLETPSSSSDSDWD